MNTNAQAVADKWASRTAAAAPDYVAGVMNTDKDPTALAIAAAPRWFAKLQEAYTQGKYTSGLQRSGKQGWQDGVRTKGETAFSNGVQNSKTKVATAFGPLLAFEAGLQSRVQAMANVTDTDKENRALAWIRGMREYRKQ